MRDGRLQVRRVCIVESLHSVESSIKRFSDGYVRLAMYLIASDVNR